MHDTTGHHRARAAAAGGLTTAGLLAAAAAAGAAGAQEGQRLADRAATQPLEALPALAWAALVPALAWAALLTALATRAIVRHTYPPAQDGNAVTGPSGPPSLGKGTIGRVAGALLTLTAVSSIAAPTSVADPVVATATASGRPPSPAGPSVATPAGRAATPGDCDDAPVPGWVPARPSRTDQIARDTAPLLTGCPVSDDSGEIVVRRGDSLWSIAAEHLGPQADATAIAAAWPAWYRANREVIGDDPDLLLVGARLHIPHTAPDRSRR